MANQPSPFAAIVGFMQSKPRDRNAQINGCDSLSKYINVSNKAAQEEATAMGAIDAPIKAMKRFPQDKQLMVACSHAVTRPILFHHDNSLRAAKLGGFNLTIAALRKWQDDPEVSRLAGDLGAYMNHCSENRDLFRRLDGVSLLMQFLKDNFHGKKTPSSLEPVRQSLIGLSSGCWNNQDLCFDYGFGNLSMQLVQEHTKETEIVERALEGAIAGMWASDVNRVLLVEHGAGEAIVKVLQELPNGSKAVTAACRALTAIVGPMSLTTPGEAGLPAWKAFHPMLQARVTRAGAVEQLLMTVDKASNVDVSCLDALTTLAYFNPSNQDIMLRANFTGKLAETVQRRGLTNLMVQSRACNLLRMMALRDGVAFTTGWTKGAGCTGVI
eukprot:CAMPEP_0171095320 /NCGR_PEP_ID=MMETSP0766_2-20121228/43102_1 /TAXON_ID=439317 /ORGANISM="Gambierdiscus australes, Strain CAWD 149" /LENGTH=383 /DNA_ID=CAMNT_0011554111 /DNA_START=119 /DNA_END=1270 /DNA_ORIENTATION=+